MLPRWLECSVRKTVNLPQAMDRGKTTFGSKGYCLGEVSTLDGLLCVNSVFVKKSVRGPIGRLCRFIVVHTSACVLVSMTPATLSTTAKDEGAE